MRHIEQLVCTGLSPPIILHALDFPPDPPLFSKPEQRIAAFEPLIFDEFCTFLGLSKPIVLVKDHLFSSAPCVSFSIRMPAGVRRLGGNLIFMCDRINGRSHCHPR